jgi:hypothetical protein
MAQWPTTGECGIQAISVWMRKTTSIAFVVLQNLPFLQRRFVPFDA